MLTQFPEFIRNLFRENTCISFGWVGLFKSKTIKTGQRFSLPHLPPLAAVLITVLIRIILILVTVLILVLILILILVTVLVIHGVSSKKLLLRYSAHSYLSPDFRIYPLL